MAAFVDKIQLLLALALAQSLSGIFKTLKIAPK
jgi:hypothetical protein